MSLQDQLQTMITEYSQKCSTLSMCPTDCQSDVATSFNTCGICLGGAAALADPERGLEALMGKKAMLESQISQLETQKPQLESEVTSIESQISELETQKPQLESQISGIQSEISQLETQKSQLETELTGIRGEITQLETQKPQLETEVSTLRGEVSQLETKKPQLETEVSNVKVQIAQVQQQVDACECKDQWYYFPVVDPSTGEKLGQREIRYFNGCDALKPDESEPWCYVKDPDKCGSARVSSGKDGEKLAWLWCSADTTKTPNDKSINTLSVANEELTTAEASLQQVINSITAVKENLTQKEASLQQVNDGIPTKKEKLTQKEASLKQVNDGIPTKKEKLTQLQSSLKQVSDGIPTAKAGLTQLQAGLKQVTDGIPAAKAGLEQVLAGISQLVPVQQACATPAPQLKTLWKGPLSLPQKGEGVTCMQEVQRFGILKEVMTAQATGNMAGLSAAAGVLMQGLASQGQSIQSGSSIPDGIQCEPCRTNCKEGGERCTQDSDCRSNNCAKVPFYAPNGGGYRACFKVDAYNATNCKAANGKILNGEKLDFPGNCNQCADGFKFDKWYSCVPE